MTASPTIFPKVIKRSSALKNAFESMPEYGLYGMENNNRKFLKLFCTWFDVILR